MDWKETFRTKIQQCDEISDRDKRLDCKFKVLYEITEFQDVTNINIMKDLNDDQDERWIPIHMVDNANAVILGVTRNRGKPQLILKEGYVEEKMRSLRSKWLMIS